MGYSHNLLAHRAAGVLLRQLQTGSAAWATPRLTSATTYWHGMADWPRPDIACEDQATSSALAVEFKPPGQGKREYVTGLGQAVTYLRSFEYAAMVVPKRAGDGFDIAAYLRDLLSEDYAASLPLALFAYDRDPGNAGDLAALVHLRSRPGPAPSVPRAPGRKVFWAYWRDLSQHDAFSILNDLDAGRAQSFEKAYKRFWDTRMVRGKALTWEGRPRKRKRPAARSYKAERLNAFLSLRHIGVLNPTGVLTEDGLRLVRLGKIYEPDSVSFMRHLARLILEAGRHIELMFWVDEQQREIPARRKKRASDYYHSLDMGLQDAGIIPRAPRARPKASFLRDEQKLWNKLGLLAPAGRGRYFHSGLGLAFNWRAIVSVLGE